ncbi:MACRO domain-containing protein 2, partial [Ophiophagus hannah]
MKLKETEFKDFHDIEEAGDLLGDPQDAEMREMVSRNTYHLAIVHSREARSYLNKTNPNILIRYVNAELLLGLAKHCAVELCGHFNQMITAEQEITLSSCSRSLEKTINQGLDMDENSIALARKNFLYSLRTWLNRLSSLRACDAFENELQNILREKRLASISQWNEEVKEKDERFHTFLINVATETLNWEPAVGGLFKLILTGFPSGNSALMREWLAFHIAWDRSRITLTLLVEHSERQDRKISVQQSISTDYKTENDGDDVIHTVGPIARGHISDIHKEDLANCYKTSLKLAKENLIRSIQPRFSPPLLEPCSSSLHCRQQQQFCLVHLSGQLVSNQLASEARPSWTSCSSHSSLSSRQEARSIGNQLTSGQLTSGGGALHLEVVLLQLWPRPMLPPLPWLHRLCSAALLAYFKPPPPQSQMSAEGLRRGEMEYSEKVAFFQEQLSNVGEQSEGNEKGTESLTGFGILLMLWSFRALHCFIMWLHGTIPEAATIFPGPQFNADAENMAASGIALYSDNQKMQKKQRQCVWIDQYKFSSTYQMVYAVKEKHYGSFLANDTGFRLFHVSQQAFMNHNGVNKEPASSATVSYQIRVTYKKYSKNTSNPAVGIGVEVEVGIVSTIEEVIVANSIIKFQQELLEMTMGSQGTQSFPNEPAAVIALTTVKEWLSKNENEFNIGEKIFYTMRESSIQERIGLSDNSSPDIHVYNETIGEDKYYKIDSEEVKKSEMPKIDIIPLLTVTLEFKSTFLPKNMVKVPNCSEQIDALEILRAGCVYHGASRDDVVSPGLALSSKLSIFNSSGGYPQMCRECGSLLLYGKKSDHPNTPFYILSSPLIAGIKNVIADHKHRFQIFDGLYLVVICCHLEKKIHEVSSTQVYFTFDKIKQLIKTVFSEGYIDLYAVTHCVSGGRSEVFNCQATKIATGADSQGTIRRSYDEKGKKP